MPEKQIQLERQTRESEDTSAKVNLYSKQLLKSQTELMAITGELRAAEDELKATEAGQLEVERTVTMEKDQNAPLLIELE